MDKLKGLLVLFLFLAIGYLVSVGILSIIFRLINIGGYDIKFSVWIGGIIFYMIYLIFKK